MNKIRSRAEVNVLVYVEEAIKSEEFKIGQRINLLVI